MSLKHIFFYSLALSSMFLTHGSESCYVATFTPDYTFEAQFTALWLKPGATNTHFAAEAFPLPVLSPNWAIHDICKKHHFAFDLLLRTQFHNAHSSLFINWEHFKHGDATAFTTNSNNMTGPFFEIGPDATPYFTSAGSVHFDFNEINLDYGQNVEFGQRLQTNLFAGISLVKLCEILRYTYMGADAGLSRIIKTPIHFKGAGLHAGLDFMYDIACRFEFTGRLSASILNGKSSNQTTYTSFSPALVLLDAPNPNIQAVCPQCTTLVVPVLFQKIGLAYAHEWCERYMITIGVGYQAQVYFNALRSTDMGSEVVAPPVASSSVGVYARTFQRNISNFSLTGAYFSFGIGF